MLETRMVDASIRLGTNEHTVAKWKAIFNIKDDFEKIIGRSIYSVLPGVIENTFEFSAEE